MKQSDKICFIETFNIAGFPTSETGTVEHTQPIELYYRNNPDGSVRWIWPARARKADFFRFYHVQGWKKTLKTLLVKGALRSGFGKLFSHGSFTVYVTPFVYRRMEKEWNHRWALFTGTIGPNRKAILWNQTSETETGCFTKLAMTAQAEKNLLQEGKQIETIQREKVQGLVVPQVMCWTPAKLKLSDIGAQAMRTNRFIELPVQATQAWLRCGAAQADTTGYEHLQQVNATLKKLMEKDDRRIPQSLLLKMQTMMQKLNSKPVVRTAYSHGDFTPWNVMMKDDALHVVDWELASRNRPVLYDLFHFIYQSNILLGNKGYKAIRQEIEELLEDPAWEAFLRTRGIDLYEAERHYLVTTIGTYLEIYHAQPEWHLQVNWLLATWENALSWHLLQAGTQSARKIVLNDVQQLLQTTEHAVLKWTYQQLDTLPQEADIDICITKDHAAKLLQQLNAHPLVAVKKVYRKSHMYQVSLILVNGELLHVDLIWRFQRKQLIFLDAADLLAKATVNEAGVRVPAVEHDFMYILLFYWLNRAEVPARYQTWLQEMTAAQQERINKYIGTAFIKGVVDFRMLWGRRKVFTGMVQRYMEAMPDNHPVFRAIHGCQYLVDILRTISVRKGLVVTFSGVDGAGKSTVINHIRLSLEKKLRGKVIVLRHRPSLLPILSAMRYGKKGAEQRAANTLPRQGANNNTASSLFRFTYYYLDYLIGQFYVQIRYVRMGYIVLYDRYYFDMINDSRRSNISISPSVVKWLYKLLIKPQLNFFLYAQEKTIRARKQELEPGTIQLLTWQYMHLFDYLDNTSRHSRYIPVENENLQETLQVVFDHIKRAAV